MIIHVIKEGETIKTIAEYYGISEEKLIQDNGIMQPNKLVIGEALVIVYPRQMHTVQNGDTLSSIADQYGVTVMELLRNNPYLSDRDYIYQGEAIVISYEDEKIRKIKTYGYALPYTDKATIRKTLPYLTYLSIEANTVTEEGEIIGIGDDSIIQMAKEYNVEPIMWLAAANKEGGSIHHTVLSSEENTKKFVEKALIFIKKKGYSGINLDTPYLSPVDRDLYLNFITYLTTRMHEEGYKVFDSFGITQFDIMTGTLLEPFEYIRESQVVDGILLNIFQTRGYEEGIPSGIISYDTMKVFAKNITNIIAREKIIMGMPFATGHIWKLPYQPGISKGYAVKYSYAIELASQNKAIIMYDDITKISHYNFTLESEDYIVRFWDARGIDALAEFIPEFGLQGFTTGIMEFFYQMWLVINTQYEIEKNIDITENAIP